MPGANLRHPKESFESLFRRYKKAVEKADTLRELRAREFFEKPSETRKRAKDAAKKRNEKRLRELEAASNPRARVQLSSAKRKKGKRKDRQDRRQSSEQS